MSTGQCDWQTGYGLPWIETCGAQTDEGHAWCPEHEQDAMETYPHLAPPMVTA